MKRINLTDGSNTWFDEDRAQKFSEDRRWDGNDWISCATGSQWYHEKLYRTAAGKYILNSWSDYEGTVETYEYVTEKRAYDWLFANGHVDAIPPEEDKARNLDTGGETPRRNVRIPDDLWTKAQATGNATKVIVDLLAKHFAE